MAAKKSEAVKSEAKGKAEGKDKIAKEKPAAQAVQEESIEDDTSYLDESAGEGYEGLQASDFQIPFLRILNPLSPQVLEGDEHVEGAKAGFFFNTLTQEVYGNEINLIPLKPTTEILEWTPGERGKLVGRHVPGTVNSNGKPYGKQVSDEGNDLVETMMIYALIEGRYDEGPVVFPLSKTSLKHARNWNTKIHNTKLPPKPDPKTGILQPGATAAYYSSVWSLRTMLNKNEKGQWYTLGLKNFTAIERVRFITKYEFLDIVKPTMELIKGIAQKLLDHPEAFKQITDGTDTEIDTSTEKTPY